MIDSTNIQFELDVSFRYRNKSGYEANGYDFNRSFKTLTLTPQGLHKVIRQGWPYTVAHHKASRPRRARRVVG